MKNWNINKYFVLLIAASSFQYTKSVAQDSAAAPVPVIKLHYFNENNSIQYILVESKLKKDGKLTPQVNKSYDLYLDSSTAENLVGKMKTNEEGEAKAFIPPALKTSWDVKPQHTFILKEGDNEIITDYAITKSKIEIDTSSADGVRSITATLKKLQGTEWVPAADVEMKLGIKRLGGILPAGDEPTYTTDSTGTVTVEVKKDSLPGDEKGNLILAARVEDNDLFGNLQVEKTVSWGVSEKFDNSFFNKRTLWTTRFRTPYWLLIVATSVIVSVWGTLLYLIFQVIKIKRLGKVKVQTE